MYTYVTDYESLREIRQECGEIIQQLCHMLKVNYDIGVKSYLVGSGKRKLITQNGNGPIDLDYNIEIVRIDDYEDCKRIKDAVMNAFNEVLGKYKWQHCKDSTSSIKASPAYFLLGKMNYAMDVAIVCEDEKGYKYRLIHKKADIFQNHQWMWEKAPASKKVEKKTEYIKRIGGWSMLREEYLNIKNHYLTINDYHHPSYICYIEAVNNVYNHLHNAG